MEYNWAKDLWSELVKLASLADLRLNFWRLHARLHSYTGAYIPSNAMPWTNEACPGLEWRELIANKVLRLPSVRRLRIAIQSRVNMLELNFAEDVHIVSDIEFLRQIRARILGTDTDISHPALLRGRKTFHEARAADRISE